MDEISDIKAKLQERLRELKARAVEIDDELSEAPDADWAENAVESENDEVLEQFGSLALDEIRKINTALAKIEAGTYGVCELCDKPISPKRLEALPYASTCIECTQEG